jgi:hypothetical protein
MAELVETLMLEEITECLKLTTREEIDLYVNKLPSFKAVILRLVLPYMPDMGEVFTMLDCFKLYKEDDIYTLRVIGFDINMQPKVEDIELGVLICQ